MKYTTRCNDAMWRVLAAGCLAVLLAVASGCGNDNTTTVDADGTPTGDDSGDSQTPAEPNGDALSDANLFDESEDTPTAKSTPGEVESPTVVKATVVGEQAVKEMFPDKETVKRLINVKKYSDNRIVYHGEYVEFWPDATKYCEGSYVDGKRDGLWTFWHTNGEIAKRGSYAAGKTTGTWIYRREDGTMAREENYLDGKKDGSWTYYADDGVMTLKTQEYKADTEHGTWTTWFDSGEKRLEIQFLPNLVSKRTLWHQNGQKASEENFKDRKHHGKVTTWDEQGKQLRSIEYENGRRKSGKPT